MIIRSRVVVPITSEPIENGAVVVDGNTITAVGRFHEIKKRASGDVVDLGERILLPGLINAHCHFDYTMLRGKIQPQKSFTDWVLAINAAKGALSDDDYVAAITSGITEALRFGSTSLVNLAAYPQLLPRVPTTPLRIWWCAEMIDVRAPVPVRELFSDLSNWFQSVPNRNGGIGLAPHALYTASHKLFSEAEGAAGKNNLLTTHVAESRDEMEMFREGNGPLFNFLQSIGRPMNDCGQTTPISQFLNLREINRNWIVAHLNEVADSDFELLARSEKFHVTHCPRSHAFFGHAPFALRKLQQLRFNICLGTDSLASNSSLSLFAEMRELMNAISSVSSREALAMATINGAAALGATGQLGQIKLGAKADLIAIPCTPTKENLFDQIVAFDEEVPWTMLEGQILPPE